MPAASKMRFLMLACLAPFFLLALQAAAQTQDPFDPFETQALPKLDQDWVKDKDKSAEELLFEGEMLMLDERWLDARSKLLLALSKDPKNPEIYMDLAAYYMQVVGHFRLAIKYVKQAYALFEQKYGPPPYHSTKALRQHERLLYLLAQARLNLDNYQGALDVLDKYSAFGYSGDWYAGTRSWTLMKLGRLQEALRVARLGVTIGPEPGRTLNMLGILLSMTGERNAALKVFQDAVAYELSQGDKDGKPATPLNNAGEVYKEIFDEERAEISWLRAIRMPDGCEHVLPSLNLTLLYVDMLNLPGARKTMDDFEICVAKEPLKNGEEHRALVNLARGRIAIHSGKLDTAIGLLEQARERRQWFGKIGTSQEDLEVASVISLAQALRYKNNQISATLSGSSWEWLVAQKDRLANAVHARWLMRRARQILSEDLKNIEDLYVRNTDSLIEYPTFGEVLSGFPLSLIKRRIEAEAAKDKRPEARTYYQAWLAEAYLKDGDRRRGLEILSAVESKLRAPDRLLALHLMLLRLGYLEPGGKDYTLLSQEVFAVNKAALRNYGFKLPVKVQLNDPAIKAELSRTSFLPLNAEGVKHSLLGVKTNAGYEFTLYSPLGASLLKVQSQDLSEAINKLNQEVFGEPL